MRAGTDRDEYFMREAIAEASAAADAGEVPVGAVVVRGGEIIARGRNTRERDGVATGHAEIMAIESACRALGGWRLSDCTIYVTLEPCPMCAGAIVNARIARVVYGAKDARAGAFGSVIDMRSYPLESKPEVIGGVLTAECAEALSRFFAARR